MSLSEAGLEGGTVPQPHTTAGLVVAIVGVLFGNQLGGLLGALIGLVGGFIVGFLVAVAYFSLQEYMEPEILGGDGGEKGEGAAED